MGGDKTAQPRTAVDTTPRRCRCRRRRCSSETNLVSFAVRNSAKLVRGDKESGQNASLAPFERIEPSRRWVDPVEFLDFVVRLESVGRFRVSRRGRTSFTLFVFSFGFEGEKRTREELDPTKLVFLSHRRLDFPDLALATHFCLFYGLSAFLFRLAFVFRRRR